MREQCRDVPVQIDYDGESRELKRSAGGLLLTFGFALLIVYLVLAAQFESFVHPLVILAAVPMALTGALFGLWLFGSSHQHLQPDRRGDADRHRQQERHPDRGVRQPVAGSRARVRRGHHRGGHRAPAAGADDHAGHGSRRRAADARHRRRRREPAVHRRDGVLRRGVRRGADAVRGAGAVCKDRPQYALPAVPVAADRPPARQPDSRPGSAIRAPPCPA